LSLVPVERGVKVKSGWQFMLEIFFQIGRSWMEVG